MVDNSDDDVGRKVKKQEIRVGGEIIYNPQIHCGRNQQDENEIIISNNENKIFQIHNRYGCDIIHMKKKITTTKHR